MNKDVSSVKKRNANNSTTDQRPRKVLRSTLIEFNWKSLCFICGCSKKKGNSVLHNASPGESVKNQFVQAAKSKNDIEVQNRLALLGEFDLASVGAVYHKSPCYNSFLSAKKISETVSTEIETLQTQSLNSRNSGSNFDSYSNTSDENAKSEELVHEEKTTDYSYADIMQITLDKFKERLNDFEIIPFTEICATFEKIYFEQYKEETTARKSYLKSKMLDLASNYDIDIYSEKGLPNLIYLNNIPTHYFVKKIYDLSVVNKNLVNEIDTSKLELKNVHTDKVIDQQQSDILVLHNAVRILRNNMSEIPKTKYYPTVDELKLEFSKEFVPLNLQLFFSWLISQEAFSHAATIPDHDFNNLRRMLTLSECTIFCSNNASLSIIPPFHFGLTLQLHHRFGSKFLIDTLNAYGLCATYDELRRFLTALAKIQIAKNNKVYVPPKIIDRRAGGSLIQEGADNVDICTETIDGKDTYHAMARVIYQSQDIDVRIPMVPIERQQEKSLNINDIPFLNMVYYKKPSKKPEPPVFPGAVNRIDVILKSCTEVLRNNDVAWVILRSFCRGLLNDDDNPKQVFPNWVPFNMRFSKKKDTVTAVQYGPTIHAKPSDLNTVFTTLIKGLQLAKECGQAFAIQTYDAQLFALAQYIKFDLAEQMKDCVVRLGSFHTLDTFIACIGKIWGDACLRDLLVESEVYAGKTVDSMLAGKQFYRAVRGLTLSYEVLVTLLLEQFFEWIEKHDKDLDNSVSDLIVGIQHFKLKYAQNNCSEEDYLSFNNKINTIIMSRLNEFIEVGCEQSPTFKFMIQCLQSIQILLDFLRAERNSEWNSHLVAQVQMLPYFFVCKRPNYSRYGTLYAVDMLMNLPEEVKSYFQAGHFTINLTPGPFRGIFSDMSTEMTVIKNTKAANAGITGLTRKPASVLRWALTQNVTGEYASEMHNRSNIKDSDSAYDNYVHEGEKQSLFYRDEEDFIKMLNYAKSHMTNPFSLDKYTPSLINISTGCIAPPEVSASLLGAKQRGLEKMFEFLQRLEKTSNKSFHEPITRSDLKTFSDIQKCTVYKINGKETKKIVKPDVVFKRALIVSDSRPNVNLRMIMSVPLTDIPCILFKPDGTRRKTKKSDLLQLLEKVVLDDIITDEPDLQAYNCIVIDGMAELQALNAKNLVTFNDVGNQIMQKIIKKLVVADEIHLIFDRYDDSGINPKQEERFSRYGNGSQRVEIIGNRLVKDFKKVLANNDNKSALTDFIAKYLQKHLPDCEIMSNESKKVFVAGGIEPRENTYVISKNYQYADFNLECNHLDADTRIIFHVSEIQSRHTEKCQIIVESPDTDVFILLLSHYTYFDSNPLVWFYTGKTDSKLDHRRFIPIHKLYEQIGSTKSSALITLHATSGCDTVSSFNYIGKKKAYAAFNKLSESDISDFVNIVSLPADKALSVVTKWLSLIYIQSKHKSKKTIENDVVSINDLRYKIASTKDTAVDKLPPSQPTLLQHILRIKWQVNEWSQARSSNITSFDPTQYGWILENDVLRINYFEGDTAIQMLQKFICSCSGKSPCKDEEICSCLSQGLKCCDLCSCCENCSNDKESNDCTDSKDECEIETEDLCEF